MPTIKTKKEMNLPELIEWGWKNEIEKRSFISNGGKVTANFEDMGHFITDSYISKDVTFTVEVEEEITEDMKLHTVERFISRYENKYKYEAHHNKSIKDIFEYRLPYVETTHIYAEIDNDLVLIWRDGKLVE